MRIVSSIALAVFLASTNTDAFGPASPLRPSAFGSNGAAVISNAGGGGSSSSTLTMRIGFSDLARRQRINRILDSNPTVEVVQSVLLSPETSALIQKCSRKVRGSMIRKVGHQAARYGVVVDPKFGVPPTQTERETSEQGLSAVRKQERLTAMAKDRAQVLARQEARQVKRTANKARAAEFAAKLKSEREARQAAAAAAAKAATPAAVAPPAAAPVVAKPEPVAAAAVENPPAPKPVAKVAAPEPVEKTPVPEPVAKVAAPTPVKEPAVPKPVAKVAAPAPVKEPAVPEPVAKVVAPAVVAETPAAAAAAPASAGAAGGEITPKTIKALRDATGAGMMDCKRALIETDGDQEAAAENLRKKGLSKADKKASRIAAEGKITIASSSNKAVMVEVNCETDLVAKDGSFLGFCEKVAGAAIAAEGDVIETLMATEVGGESLEATRQAMVAKIGENIQVRRMASRGGEGRTVGGYVHMNSIGVLVELEGGDEQLCKDIAMHVAAMNPPFATADDVPAEVLETEKRILSEQALESGKKPEIVEKMVEGRIRKFLEEKCLVSQPYVKDGDKTVGKLLKEKGAKIIGFTRLVVGEGIEKKQDDFAAEVAKMAGIKADEPAPAAV